MEKRGKSRVGIGERRGGDGGRRRRKTRKGKYRDEDGKYRKKMEINERERVRGGRGRAGVIETR